MTLFQIKEQDVLDTPLFLFDCTFSNGTVYNWSTHHVVAQGRDYQARVMRTNVLQMQVASDGGVDTIPKITFELANADGLMSELQRGCGFKGATLSVRFVFYNLSQNTATSETLPVFQGILDAPELVTESTLRVAAINRLSLQRIALPPVQVQKRCPWQFPTNADNRREAVTGGGAGRFSQFYNCGYSPDVPGGCGNLDHGAAFADCDYSRAQCEQRGMFSTDASGRTTARFGGIEFVPPVISVRPSGAKSAQLSVIQDNEGRYNDYVPMIYGTGWYYPSIVFARNDGNLTHFEVLLGSGQMTKVTTVLVNNIEIPIGRAGANMTGTGWYNVASYGTRNGVFNNDFTDSQGKALGDPYGSMAYVSIVVPNSINDGQSVPSIQVLIDGLEIETFASDGTSQGFRFVNNPVWVILDILRRCGWSLTEIDLASFNRAAAYCDEPIQTTDLNGNSVAIARFQCNLILQSRRSAGDVIRCIRNASRLYLNYASDGLLQMNVENTVALQQSQLALSSNATVTLNGGWPVYEFGDGTNGTTGIARLGDQSSSFQITSRSSADTPNRFSVAFQDAFNSYQQDSVTLVDPDDVHKCGFQVSATPNVLGVPNYNQALRIIALCLEKSIAGNTYVEFQTSVRALGIQPGDIIAVTHSREGYDRTPFRVVKVSPGQNFRTALIRAQLHDDSWYTDDAGNSAMNTTQQPSYSIGVPRSLIGVALDQDGNLQYGVTETSTRAEDGTALLTAGLTYTIPPSLPVSAPGAPIASLSPTVFPNGGTLPSNSAFYYALTSVDSGGDESGLSFAIPAVTGSGTATYCVALKSISLPKDAVTFHVYRGPSPAELTRIASNNAPSDSFVDAGLASLPYLPPDASFDHANFYWRAEMQPPAVVTIHSPNTVGSGSLHMEVNEFAGMTVRIMTGKGSHQELVILSNTNTTLTTTSPWMIAPDTSSTFVISQTGYQFGASSNTNQVQFSIPNRPGSTIQICGRSANVYNVESPYELSTVTRWLIGGAGIGAMDSAVPPAPVFGLTVQPEEGGVELCGLGFHTLDNTRTISLGTLTLYYFDESSVDSPPVLAADLGATDTTLTLSSFPDVALPQYIAVGQEIIRLNASTAGGVGFSIDRGLHTTTAASHSAQTPALPLKLNTVSYPFLEDFFGSPASGNWSQSIALANARVCSAELFFSNSQGNGSVGAGAFTTFAGGGLRTLTGGQITLQVPGFLAVQDSAVPPLDPGATYSVRDMYAYVGSAPTADTAISLQVTLNGAAYGPVLTIPCGSTQSSSVDGSTLPVLRAGGRIGLSIQAVGEQSPGSDLTVVIRV